MASPDLTGLNQLPPCCSPESAAQAGQGGREHRRDNNQPRCCSITAFQITLQKVVVYHVQRFVPICPPPPSCSMTHTTLLTHLLLPSPHPYPPLRPAARRLRADLPAPHRLCDLLGGGAAAQCAGVCWAALRGVLVRPGGGFTWGPSLPCRGPPLPCLRSTSSVPLPCLPPPPPALPVKPGLAIERFRCLAQSWVTWPGQDPDSWSAHTWSVYVCVPQALPNV
jgi:hypothetical protein